MGQTKRREVIHSSLQDGHPHGKLNRVDNMIICLDS